MPSRSPSVMPSSTDEPLDLMERRRVRRVGGVAAIDAAERDDVDGRLLRLHRPDLRRRGLRPEHRLVVEEERLQRRARRMARREVERVEVVVRRLDLAAVDDRVPEPEEDVLDLAPDLRDEVEMPAPDRASRASSRRRAPRSAAGRARRARAPPARASIAASSRSRSAFSAIPVSRSRTSRSASLSSLLRPRYSTRTCSISSTDVAASTAARAAFSSAWASTGAPRLPNGSRRFEPRLHRTLHLVPGARAERGHDTDVSSSMTLYDPIAAIYDPWSRSVTEDVDFYVEQALASRRPGRRAGRRNRPDRDPDRAGGRRRHRRRLVAGHARGRASRGRGGRRRATSSTCASATCASRPCTERVAARPLPVPHAAAHGDGGREAARAPRGARPARSPTAASSSTSSPRAARTSTETHGRWLEREPGIFERADWDEGVAHALALRPLGRGRLTTFGLHWLSAPEWLRLLDAAGFAVEAVVRVVRRPPARRRGGHGLRRPRDRGRVERRRDLAHRHPRGARPRRAPRSSRSTTGSSGSRNRVDNAWAQIEVQLKRRWDLIPNLVETRQGLRGARARDVRGGHAGARRRAERAEARPRPRRRRASSARRSDGSSPSRRRIRSSGRPRTSSSSRPS